MMDEASLEMRSSTGSAPLLCPTVHSSAALLRSVNQSRDSFLHSAATGTQQTAVIRGYDRSHVQLGPLLIEPSWRNGDRGAQLLGKQRDSVFLKHPAEVEQLGIDNGLRLLIAGLL
jgi:hypothetical protein